MSPKNELASSPSPYLRQHGSNPVHWRGWSAAALEKAKQEDKPLLISIGYAACHWCHVMAHESFEDEEIAEEMNSRFVPIKVDREERPDVDGVYMTAVQIISGRGGWPLHCFAFPDGRPFFGGTYFPPASWKSVLRQIAELWENDRPRLEAAAEDIVRGVKAAEGIGDEPPDEEVTMDAAKDAYYRAAPSFDPVNGGQTGAPKFPVPGRLITLLEFAAHTNNEDAFAHVELTLEKMAGGGIYDQLGGGFSRYSVDGQWRVPHFEKMLYDNAQLIELYGKAHLLRPRPLYERTVMETHEFLCRELLSPEGGFFSSLDADSEGVEGKYYVWSHAEISSILGDEAPLFCTRYGLTPEGNWEDGKNVLYIAEKAEAVAAAFGLTEGETEKRLSHSKAVLLSARAKRVSPALDDKILLSWNALLLKGCTWAYIAFNDSKYLDTAFHIAEFILTHLLLPDGGLYSVRAQGKSFVPAFASDYALLADALLDLYETVFDGRYLTGAETLASRLGEKFLDSKSGILNFSARERHAAHGSHEPALFASRTELIDNVLPSSNAVAADVFLRLGHILKRDDLLRQSRTMTQLMRARAETDLSNHYRWMSVLMKEAAGIIEIGVTGKREAAYAEVLELKRDFIPEAVFSHDESGRMKILVCKNRVCSLPASSAAEARERIRVLQGR